MSDKRGYDTVKRALDLLVGGSVLLLTAPLQLVLAVLVRRDIGSPVLFRQVRPGRHGEPFTLIKFRTMRDGTQPDAERTTPLGRTLRSTSLDELPTLWNVVRGDMSLVGPRPLLLQYLHRYSPLEQRRHEVRPGITGLAQVSGRNLLSWDEKFRADIDYVDARSLALDARILVATLRSVVHREGIHATDGAQMPEFFGRSGVDA